MILKAVSVGPRLSSIACFLVVCLAISDARAEEPWRILDNTNEGSTSDCIGNPKTPLCAVETAEACLKRGAFDLCRRVGYTWKELGRWETAGYILLYYNRYRLAGSGVIRQSDIPPARKALKGLRVRAGDVALRLKWQGCAPDDQCVMETINHATKSYGEGCRRLDSCKDVTGFATYILRRDGTEWDMLLQYYHPIFQGDFWNRK
jgi:hypothetical protein